MAITSEILGKLGSGGGAEVVPVSAPHEYGAYVLHRVTVPAGQQYLVAVTGQGDTSTSATASFPELQIGDMATRMASKNTEWSCVAVVTQDTNVIFYHSSITRARFDGTIYIAEM